MEGNISVYSKEQLWPTLQIECLEKGGNIVQMPLSLCMEETVYEVHGQINPNVR